MKKKFLSFLIGAMAICQFASAQASFVIVSAPNAGPNGTVNISAGAFPPGFVQGGPNAAPVILPVGTMVSFNGSVTSPGGVVTPITNLMFNIVPVGPSVANNGPVIEGLETFLTNFFAQSNIQFAGGFLFGTNGASGDVTLDARIPFDFGLSAVLGAGALAAVRTARKRKAEQAQATV